MPDDRYYKCVRSLPGLRKAWEKVLENGLQSKSRETRIQVREFSKRAYPEIARICRRLKDHKFSFAPAKGVPISRPGKKPRPIVVSPIPNRIVQRRLLDVIQDEPKIQEYVLLESSFGGLKCEDESRTVKQAVARAYELIMGDGKWYIRSDISDFFTHIPKDIVLDKIGEFIPDSKFSSLLRGAVTVELENLAALGKNRELFPIYDIGVAQGCCLSPLIGNILLHDFDVQMNGRGVFCIRYIDDFLIIGPTRKKVVSAFKHAKEFLEKLGMSVYDPLKDLSKAKLGETGKGLKFLGCEILPGLIRPSSDSRQRLLKKIDELFRGSERLMASPMTLMRQKRTVAETLIDASNILKGWGNQYSFCNDTQIMEYLDREIDGQLKRYFARVRGAKSNLADNPKEIRRLLGIHLLTDSKSAPIVELPGSTLI